MGEGGNVALLTDECRDARSSLPEVRLDISNENGFLSRHVRGGVGVVCESIEGYRRVIALRVETTEALQQFCL